MPIRPENRGRYPADWPATSRRIRERAGWKCERCGLPQYAVGYRESDGRFVRGCGNSPWDAAGAGLSWPSLDTITYAEAREFADAANCCTDGRDDDGHRWIVIVLTVAHLDHTPENCDPANLAALCQRCHLTHDAALHAASARETRERRSPQGVLALGGAA